MVGRLSTLKASSIFDLPFLVDSHADTWPNALSLVPTRELGLSSTDLHTWIKRFRPALCHLQVQPRGQDSKVNQSNYDSLVQLLREKKLVCNRTFVSRFPVT
jgi:hypothetical protein